MNPSPRPKTPCLKTAELQQVLRQAHGPLQHLRAFLNGLPSASQGGRQRAVSAEAYEFALHALEQAEAERAICLQAIAGQETHPEVCDLASLVRSAAGRLRSEDQGRLLLDLPEPSQPLWIPRERMEQNLAILMRQSLESQSGPVHVFAPAAGEGMHVTLTWSADEAVPAEWTASSATALALLDLGHLDITWSAPQLPAPQTGLVLQLEGTLHPHAFTPGGRHEAA